MRPWFLFVVISSLASCAEVTPDTGSAAIAPCSEAWNQKVEDKVTSGDGQGHGPDLGSLEWRSVVEFKLGIRDSQDKPDLDSDAWCTYIDEILAGE
ncbi:hypothetical protein [Paraferrimonas sedimenticola]|uniref:Lipoprotein n=1 Tax=Paraferrimonas sedimenticola TaxID=375674 RepID=A0AA37RW39_9GAMM|nr:hypothetical protein [Paraferrimonas sedimenticola]GLP96435.1 hypothetical protein GCM10007895_17410 [Paraferrimonas sedimenticola]